jgi:hypothetical protein
MTDVTRILSAIEEGDPSAAEHKISEEVDLTVLSLATSRW